MVKINQTDSCDKGQQKTIVEAVMLVGCGTVFSDDLVTETINYIIHQDITRQHKERER